MRSIVLRVCIGALATGIAVEACAHPGHGALGGAGGMLDGFLHPLSGADHMTAMIVVGIWAVQLGGRARWALPMSFLAAMCVGAVLGFEIAGLDRVAPSTIESGIAASLLVLGILVAQAGRMPVLMAMALTAGFAAFHGLAHGLELPSTAAPWRYVVGFVAATALLHLGGIVLGTTMQRRAPAMSRFAGLASAISGVALWLG